MKKILSLIIITLLLTMICAPLVNSQTLHQCKTTSKSISKEPADQVDLHILNFGKNGIVEKNVKSLSLHNIKALSTQLQKTTDVEKQIQLCKEYGLLSKDVSLQTFEEALAYKMNKHGITKEMLLSLYLQSKALQLSGLIFNPGSIFVLATGFGLWLPLGDHLESSIVPIPGKDLVTLTYFTLGGAGSIGLLGKQGGGGRGFLATVGFVGIMAYVPALPTSPGIMIGAALLTLGGFQ